MIDASFSQRIIAWQRQSGRHDLPWQKDVSPYRIWVSEIMLQQTQVATVISYFERFISSLPDMASLASASEDAVLHYWSGLGYYSRARNLLRAARIVMQEHRGQLPRDFDSLVTLPGIGRSTAGAILALSWGDRFPILDGNAKRVLTRYVGIHGWPGERQIENKLWKVAQRLLPEADVAAYTQGIMDIGATICRRTHPLCNECPLHSTCVAFLSGDPQQYPGRRPRREKPVRSTQMLVIRNQQGYLLERRPVNGIWGGLWSFPQLPNDRNVEDWLRQRFGDAKSAMQPLPAFRHTFSHFHLDVQPILVEASQVSALVMDDDSWLWYTSADNQPVGLAAPVKKLLNTLERDRRE